MMTTALLALIRNDIRLFLSDRRAVMVTIIVPVGIASFFALILGGGAGGSGRAQGTITLLIADADRSPVSRQIVANLEKDPTLKVQTATEAEARENIRQGKAPVALLLPKDFARDADRALFSGPDAVRPKVSLLYDPSHGPEYQMVRGLVMQQVMETVTRQAFSGQSAPGNIDERLHDIETSPTMPPEDKAALTDMLKSVRRYYGRPAASSSTASPSPGASEHGETGGFTRGGLQMPVTLTDEAIAGKNAQETATVAHAFAGMAVQGILFFAIDAALGILRDRRNGIWKRLRAAPLSRALLLGGKFLSTALIAFLILGIVFGAGMAFFGIRVGGSLPGFLLVCACSALTIAAFGLLVAALGRTEAQSRGYAVPAVLGMSLLGGAWFPSFMMPGWVQTVSRALPSRWALDGFDATLWRGLDFGAVQIPCVALLGFTVGFGLFALARFRWDAE